MKFGPTQKFHSRPDLRPPAIKITATGDPGAGDVFLDAQAAPQMGPIILDSRGRLVWFDPIPRGQTATDVRVQSYGGQPVLTFWQGRAAIGHGAGQGMILNTAYQTIATVRAGNGYHADLHEFLITPQGTALITVYAPVRADLRSIGGPRNGTVLDGIVQDVDIRTGKVLWEWHSLGHIPLTDSHAAKPAAGVPYDYFHINSVEQLPGGNIVISARNTWTIYYINRKTGKIAWQLGGKHSSFKMGSRTQFEWQHDARLNPDGTLTLFDNAAAPPIEKQSRGMLLKLDGKTMRATLIRAFFHAPSVLAGSQGNVQTLPDGNVFVGFGAGPNFTEYTPSGRTIFNGAFAVPAQSYRAYRMAWTGRPASPPAIAVNATKTGGLTVYASWNGATGVAAWQVMAGSSATSLTALTKSPSTGFETAIAANTTQPYIAVQALDSRGQVLGSSTAVPR